MLHSRLLHIAVQNDPRDMLMNGDVSCSRDRSIDLFCYYRKLSNTTREPLIFLEMARKHTFIYYTGLPYTAGQDPLRCYILLCSCLLLLLYGVLALSHVCSGLPFTSIRGVSEVFFVTLTTFIDKYLRIQAGMYDCNAAIALCPEFSQAHSQLGFIFSVTGKFQEAVDAYNEAARLDPDNTAYVQLIRAARVRLNLPPLQGEDQGRE